MRNQFYFFVDCIYIIKYIQEQLVEKNKKVCIVDKNDGALIFETSTDELSK